MQAAESGHERIQVPEGHGTPVDLVHAALRDAIVHGRLAPGYRLREVPLSRRFSVSTTPIREAIRRLERERFGRLRASSWSDCLRSDEDADHQPLRNPRSS